MRTFRLWITAFLAFAAWSVSANIPDGLRKAHQEHKVQYRDVCSNSKSQIDQEINNVRARLLGGGDCWWDFTNGRYIVPKIDPSTGQREVSSIFAGSVWLGGVDAGNNLKLACQDYRSDAKNDFWPGPLDPASGTTEQYTCSNWDRHFRVTGEEIRRHLDNLANGRTSPDDIPIGVKGWPARGNPYFSKVWGFELPDTKQSLAGFYEPPGGNGRYDPLKGCYPSIEIRGCPTNRYPDEMIFWVYNDQGGGAPHARTQGKPIQMEVQVQAFGYLTNDQLNDMTFQRYKLINRATQRIDSMFFAMWIDPDLGCSIDDYIGCDTSRNLMYVYNQDAQDGQPGTSCDGGVATYGDHIPILGVDYFRGPLDTVRLNAMGEEYQPEIGMSSFMYYNRGGTGLPNGTTDPTAPGEYYNYITGTWKDGTPLTYGGNGYTPGNPNAKRIRYCFTETPDNNVGWSMCSANLGNGDRRTLQASGPFILQPGALNELIIGIPWVADQTYPCPDMINLFRADDLAQGLFDACFNLLTGPDAPTTNWIELDREVIAVLSNHTPSNNVGEGYHEQDFLAPADLIKTKDPKSYYNFEGYLVYQLNSPNVSTADFTNTDKSRLVYNVDIKNGITKIYNWIEGRDPATKRVIYFPELKVTGTDSGIRHTFSVKEDKFATGNDKTLINHKKYYYAVIAYAYNNYLTFDPLSQPYALGQPRSYLPGRKSGDGSPIQIYTVIPRPIVDRSLQASYGDGVEITRLEGQGAGGNFLDLTQETRDRMFTSGFDSTLTYQSGKAPINITIFNPFEVKNGDYELLFTDHDATDNILDTDARWQVRQLPDGAPIASEKSIQKLNEQLISQYGFSVSIAQTDEPGDLANNANGGIGMELEYTDPNNPWLIGHPSDPNGDNAPFNYVKTQKLHADYDPNGDHKPLDPFQGLTTLGNDNDGPLGWFIPYVLADWRLAPLNNSPLDRLMSPAWQDQYSTIPEGTFSAKASFGAGADEENRRAQLAALPNVDIVLTSDKSKWSRCPIIEAATPYYTDTVKYATSYLTNARPESPATRKRQHFDIRYALSVGKDDANGDGLPDPDGEVYPAGSPNGLSGKPVRGMGWFPGYAVDVETGRRLNVFFSENSCFSKSLDPRYTGRDMLWNPTDQLVIDNAKDIQGAILGGQHWIYVAYSTYDEGVALRNAFTPEVTNNAITIFQNKIPQIKAIAWTGMMQVAPGLAMKSLKDGLIPNDVRIKLRVQNSYKTWYDPTDHTKKSAHPKYLIKIKGKEALPLNTVQVQNSLDSVKAVPNPYYGFSQYETTQFTNTIKITNLPAKCTVTIYSLDGKFIRQYTRNEVYAPYMEIAPDLEWDMKNSKGIPVASGIYLFQIHAPDVGDRTVKWFGIARQFDPTGL
jgi:hypothetical protein